MPKKENLTIKEKTMIDAYDEKPTVYIALAEEGISAELRSLITEQKAQLRVSHDEIKALRDAQA